MRYRIAPTIWSLVTAHDETERCMFVGDGVRCERRTEYLISSIAELACAYLCGVHIDFVRQVGPKRIRALAEARSVAKNR